MGIRFSVDLNEKHMCCVCMRVCMLFEMCSGSLDREKEVSMERKVENHVESTGSLFVNKT